MNSGNVHKLEKPEGYRPLNPASVLEYLGALPKLTERLGGAPLAWRAREVGDGNLNLVFIVEGEKGAVCVKQALPYVRMVGESWPLPLSRAHFEHAALVEQAQVASAYVPAIYHYDQMMALTVMEYLTPHIILRKGLIAGKHYPKMAEHLGEFLALTLFHSSDLFLEAEEKKQKLAFFAGNTAMCKISEDLIFDEPYFTAPMNRHTAGLEGIAESFKHDAALKIAAQSMKWRFMNHAEALLHGDLHTGSVMVTEEDTRAIDPEFAFYGPMGFDIGALIANFLLAYYAAPGHGHKAEYAHWILNQIPVLWESFAERFATLWRLRSYDQPGGEVYHPRVMETDSAEAALVLLQNHIWEDALGFAGLKMIRRILGLAHVEDMEAIRDVRLRAKCEAEALALGRMLLLRRAEIASPAQLLLLIGAQS